MPGRQNNGPLGGGGGGGGGFGGGGGGFRGGGGGFGGGGGGWGGGGGFRGGGGWGGWGGGPRWGGGWGGGGWGWRPRFSWWRPFGFGYGGYGIPMFGGGCGGCGVVLILVITGITALSGGLFNGGGGYASSYNTGYNNSGYANNSNTGNTSNTGSSGGGGLSSQPPQVQTQTALDLAELHGALDTKIPQWESAIGANQEKHVTNVDAGMPSDNNIKDIVYGKCGTDFYVFVIDKGAPTNPIVPSNGQGYAYTTAPSPSTCHPTEYQVTDWENDGGGYWAINTQS